MHAAVSLNVSRCSPSAYRRLPKLEPYFTGSNLPTRLGASSPPRPLSLRCSPPAVTFLSRRSVAPATGLSVPAPPPPRAERRGRARPPPDPPPARSAVRRFRSRAAASGAEIRPDLNWGFCSLLVSDPGLLGVLPCLSGSRFRSQFGSKSLLLSVRSAVNLRAAWCAARC
ncbi:hypothetical protein SETIT_5G267400v2 [Setaria italica]|uniref:Uncharacterized protein n=1 Tax=Setaria italica TaxID=4555 RepID=A0A368R9A3_SETIT|nr:hypothetical protein SETIT_5G267400v2 [Setaria italica]